MASAEEVPLAENILLTDIDNVVDPDRINTSESMKMKQALYHVIVAVLLPIIIFPLSRHTDLSIEDIVAIAILFIFSTWGIQVFFFLFSADRIYRIYSLIETIDNWTKMSINVSNIKYETHPIESTSEFSAIAGGVCMQSSARISSYIWAILVFYYAIKLGDQEWEFKIDSYFMLIGYFGLFLMGTFYYDAFSTKMRTMHLIGFGLLCIGPLIAFLIQRINDNNRYLWIAIVLIIINVIGNLVFWIWQLKPSDDVKVVKRHSIMICLVEAILFGAVMIATLFYFIMYD